MSDFYRVIANGEGFYRLESKENVFCELIIGKEKALLFDTGYGLGDLRAAVESLTSLPLIVVSSHGHLDHTCGNFQFADCPIYIHEKDMELYKMHNSIETRTEAVYTGRHTMDYMTHQVCDIIPEGFDEEAYINAGYPEAMTVKEGDMFDLGGIMIEVVELPGHTKGSIGLLCREAKKLLVGDAINQFLWLFAEEADTLSTYINTLEKALSLGIEEVYGGHNPMTITPADIEIYLDHARHLDFSKGVPFKASFESLDTSDARLCLREGYTMEDMMKPGFCGIVISPSHF